MKKCNTCGIVLSDDTAICPSCQSSSFSAYEPQNQTQADDTVTQGVGMSAGMANLAVINPIDVNDNGNVVSGVVGALLFSLIGVVLYFIVYQLGIIAGVSGLIMFVLANFGYRLFAGTKNKNSLVGLIVSIVLMFVMISAAEYICVAYEFYKSFNAEGVTVTVFEMIRALPELIELLEPEFKNEFLAAVISDLAFAYIFGIIASISNISGIIKARKAQKRSNQTV